MATKFTFGNKEIAEPGAYSQIKSGINNPIVALSYGNVLIIDTGSGANYGAGSGINGTLNSGKDSILSFDNIKDFRDNVRAGLFWQISKYLWKPSKNLNVRGISNLFFVKAATTVAAEIKYVFGDHSVSDSDSQLDGGEVVVQVRNEGIAGNGVEVSNVLTRGYAGKMRAGTVDTTKFVIDFYAGTFRGLDSDSEPYTDFPGQGILEANSVPEIVCSSDEFNTVAELVDWMNNSSTFNYWFKLKSSVITGSGRVDAADLAAYTTNNLASGGTEVYGAADFTKVLSCITELDYTFILSDKWGTNAKDAKNDLLKAHIASDSKYGEFVFIGGGKSYNNFTGTNGSIDIAEHFDSDQIVVIHAGTKKVKTNGTGYKEYDSIVKAAAVLGRICGITPQVPGTFKDIDMDADMHDMTESERVRALDAGVLHTKFEPSFGEFIINQAISSIQDNRFMVNSDGTSYEISVKRIAAQLNKELVYNATYKLLRNPEGVNRNVLSKSIVEQFTKEFLSSKVANDLQDNLILSFQDITVTINQDAYEVTYGFVPNFPVNKLFFTGFMLDKNL
jgi:hypothetical protein